jgi:mannosidase alpha-like ER degradation enhancer 2
VIFILAHYPVLKFCQRLARKIGYDERHQKFLRNKVDTRSSYGFFDNKNIYYGKGSPKDSRIPKAEGFQNYDRPIGPEEYSETRYVPTEEKLKVYRERVYEMFHFSYDNYIKHAYPEDELKPISCSGQNTWGNFSLTLIDALDTFAVMNDIKGFEDALTKVEKINFDMDINISVFETTIRVLGGLLSSHLIAKELVEKKKIQYHDELLVLAEDLGQRLLPAYDTPTGMPFGSINLKRGVQPDETTETCTATIGTCSIEFAWLSILTNNPIYEFTCRRAIHSLWSHRTRKGLIGAHIDVFTGIWTEAAFSISGGVDSFYEYLLKSWIGFSDEKEYGEMFLEMYELIHKYLKKDNGWHIYANSFTGGSMKNLFQSLGAYWPGVKILAGELFESNEELNLLANYLKNRSFLPEHIYIDDMNGFQYEYFNYPLRPELVESLSVMYKATKDPKLLEVAFKQVDRIRKWCKTKCGYANIRNVYNLKKEDKMESFFLSETLKYLYLLFDPDNKFNRENYIFSTEAHPFPVVSSVQSHAKLYYKKNNKAIRRELRKINKTFDANKYFYNKYAKKKMERPYPCEIHKWACQSFPRYYPSLKQSNMEIVEYTLTYLSPDFKNIPKPRDRFTDFRKGICSYKHWVSASMMGLETDKAFFSSLNKRKMKGDSKIKNKKRKNK